LAFFARFVDPQLRKNRFQRRQQGHWFYRRSCVMDQSGDTTHPHSNGESGSGTGRSLVPYAERVEAGSWLGGKTIFDFGFRLLLSGGCLALIFLAVSRILPQQALPDIARAGREPSEVRAASDMVGHAAAALETLRAELDSVRASAARTTTVADPAVGQRLDELAAQVESVERETKTAIADLHSVQQEAAAKLQDLAARLDRFERQALAPTTSSSGPAKAQPQTSAEKAAAKAGSKRPPVIRNWILRGVEDGYALVEGSAGAFEVAPGAILPGAGRVTAIERAAHGWIVVTSRGVIEPPRGGSFNR
jgi:hypothetical protein